jgi:hypothetical protein
VTDCVRRGLVVALAAVAFPAGACSGPQPPVAPPVVAPPVAAPTITAPAAAIDAGELRERLERGFGRRAVVTVDALRATAVARPDAAASAEALAAATDAVVETFGLVYGVEGADTIGTLLRRADDLLLRDAAALADPTVRAEARAGLDGVARDLAAYLAAVTSGGAPAADLEVLLDAQTDLLRRGTQAYASGDALTAYSAAAAAYEQMWRTAGALAGAIAASGPTVSRVGVITDNGSELARLLAGSTVATVEVLRRRVDGAPDLAAAEAALRTNTAALAALVAAPADEAAFATLWRERLDALLAAALDPASSAPEAARSPALEAAAAAVGGAFVQASGDRLEPAVVTDLLAQSAELLVPQGAAWREGRYADAQRLAADAFVQASAAAGRIAPGLTAPSE